jgi:hypothetical protein
MANNHDGAGCNYRSGERASSREIYKNSTAVTSLRTMSVTMESSESFEIRAALGIVVAPDWARSNRRTPINDTDPATGLGLCSGYLRRAVLWANQLIRRKRHFLRRLSSIGAGVVSAGILSYGMTRSTQNLADLLPASTYLGFFQHLALAIDRAWSHAQGYPTWSHAQQFGQFYRETVNVLCPLVGFALFWIASRYRIGIDAWRAIMIFLALTFTPLAVITPETVLLWGISFSYSEAIHAGITVMLMVWSVGALKIRHCNPLKFLNSRAAYAPHGRSLRHPG